jgi:transcriptional regulator with XRE-family HTH domain
VTGHRSWTAERRARLADPEVARRAAEAHAELDRREEDYRRTLAQLRNARRLTQAQLAGALGVSQAQVSRVENQADLYLSTLRSYVQAMGGELELRAVFPDGQASKITIAELLGHADAPVGTPGRAPEVDVHTAFAFVHRDVGGFDAAERDFHAADAA